MTTAMEFYLWIDSCPVGGLMPFPGARAARALAANALRSGVPHGRVTLWLWRTDKKKMAVAMARKFGAGAEKPICIQRWAPPFNDDDKAQLVFSKERL